MTEPGPTGLRVFDTVFAAPPDARAMQEYPVFRPLPGAPPGLRGVALLGRRSAPVWALTPQPAAWLVLEHPGGPIIIGADAAARPAAGAPLLSVPSILAQPLPAGAIRTPSPAEATPAPARSAPLTDMGAYALHHAGAASIVPIASLEGILDMPGLDLAPQPGLPIGALSILRVEGDPALILDPGWCTGQGGPPRQTALLVVLHHAGRRFAVPVQQARPGTDGVDLAARLSGTQEGRDLLAAAPMASVPPAVTPAGALHPMLLCESGDTRFALPVAEVATVLSPRQPTPAPRVGATAGLRGVAAHRGEVLPVVDLAPELAAPLASEVLSLVPMLRLALPRAVAVPVQRILGLLMVPLRAISPVAANALIAGQFVVDGRTLPICRAAALAADAGST